MGTPLVGCLTRRGQSLSKQIHRHLPRTFRQIQKKMSNLGNDSCDVSNATLSPITHRLSGNPTSRFSALSRGLSSGLSSRLADSESSGSRLCNCSNYARGYSSLSGKSTGRPKNEEIQQNLEALDSTKDTEDLVPMGAWKFREDLANRTNELTVENLKDPTCIYIPTEEDNRLMQINHKLAFLEKQRQINYLNQVPGQPVNRYLPNKDPSSLLIDAEKLTKEEQVFQIFFIIMPIISFAFLVSFPFMFIYLVLPRVTELARICALEEEEDYKAKYKYLDDFPVVKFPEMLDIIGRPVHTIVLLFSHTFASLSFIPLLASLGQLMRRAGLPVSVVAIDLLDGSVPREFHNTYPPCGAPYLQFIHPYGTEEGESLLEDYEGMWNVFAILDRLNEILPIPKQVFNTAKRLDREVDFFVTELFDLCFVTTPQKPQKKSVASGVLSFFRSTRGKFIVPKEWERRGLADLAEPDELLDSWWLQIHEQLNLTYGIEVATLSAMALRDSLSYQMNLN
eukprot:Platyproteum_vivax@DN3282_c0_g1_i1.p1